MATKKNAHDETTQPSAPEPARDAEPASEPGIIHLGVDLGTSRSALCASNGTRASVESIVGWPKDSVSMKFLNRRVLFGAEALRHRMSLKVVKPLDKGTLRFSLNNQSPEEVELYRDAARALLEHIASLASPRPGDSLCAVIGAPARASMKNKQAIVDLAREVGIDAVMIVSQPFAVAYAVDLLSDALIIDIGAGTIDLCRMHGTLPDVEDQVTIERAGDFIDETLYRLIQEAHGEAQFTIHMVKKAKERFSSVVDSGDPAIVEFPVNGKPTRLDITQEIQRAAAAIVPDVVEAVRRLIASYDPEFQHLLRQNVVLSGGGSQIHGIQKAIEEGMEEIGGGHVIRVEEPLYAGAAGALRLAQDMPDAYWERLKA
ncbi:MAG: rod shape-determining protein [Planctomycetes bacterium]|nr:rod shape-determining protein [Planctomycetota bacterium]